MGFSLVGPSGDQKTTTNVYETNNTASINPQIDLEGSGSGASGVNVAPNIQDSAGASFESTVGTYFAPVNVTSTGSALGDAALKAIAQVTGIQDQSSETPGVASTGTTLSSLLSGNTLYYILVAIVILFLAHHKK